MTDTVEKIATHCKCFWRCPHYMYIFCGHHIPRNATAHYIHVSPFQDPRQYICAIPCHKFLGISGRSLLTDIYIYTVCICRTNRSMGTSWKPKLNKTEQQQQLFPSGLSVPCAGKQRCFFSMKDHLTRDTVIQ